MNFLPLGAERFDYRQEFKEVFKCLSERNRVRFWSEIGYESLGYV